MEGKKERREGGKEGRREGQRKGRREGRKEESCTNFLILLEFHFLCNNCSWINNTYLVERKCPVENKYSINRTFYCFVLVVIKVQFSMKQES